MQVCETIGQGWNSLQQSYGNLQKGGWTGLAVAEAPQLLVAGSWKQSIFWPGFNLFPTAKSARA